MGRCHILGLKGYRNIIKKQAEDSAGVTRIHYPWVGTVFCVQRYYAKKGEAGTLICVDSEGCCIFAILIYGILALLPTMNA